MILSLWLTIWKILTGGNFFGALTNDKLISLARSRIDPEALVIQDCGLNDEHLSVMGKRVSDSKFQSNNCYH